MKKIILTAALLGLVGCWRTDETASAKTLTAAGYSDFEFTGYKWGACGEGDEYTTGFVAKNPRGMKVSGVVCCGGGWFTSKGCTIRF